MRVEKLRQVYLVAEDLEAQVAFFGERLGLELQFRDGDRWVQFKAGDVSFALASAAEGMGVPPGIPVPVFQVDDLDKALAEVCRGRERPSVHEMGPRGRAAVTVDPAGVRVVLHQRG
jgi:predicted enzyme related to lactoylglutathione lyase